MCVPRRTAFADTLRLQGPKLNPFFIARERTPIFLRQRRFDSPCDDNLVVLSKSPCGHRTSQRDHSPSTAWRCEIGTLNDCYLIKFNARHGNPSLHTLFMTTRNLDNVGLSDWRIHVSIRSVVGTAGISSGSVPKASPASLEGNQKTRVPPEVRNLSAMAKSRDVASMDERSVRRDVFIS